MHKAISICLVVSLSLLYLPQDATGVGPAERQVEPSMEHKTCAATAPATATTSSKTATTTATTKDQNPLKVFVLVEPSPFTYISGYANRFQALCQYLAQDFGDDVHVVTAEEVVPNPPGKWRVPSATIPTKPTATIPIHYTPGIKCPGYRLLTLSFDWKGKLPRLLWNERPDIVHVSSPGLLVFPAVFWCRLMQIPLVCSYHTHLPRYVHSHFSSWVAKCLEPVLWCLIRMVLNLADLTLVTSPQIQQELVDHGVTKTEVWLKGIDANRFHPKHFDREMRRRMLGSNSHDTADNAAATEFLMVYVGRLSHEKRLADLLPILQKMADDARLCFVGAGPQERELRQYFARTNTIFMGQLQGDELSQAFASADVFVMPSDSETLGFVVLESMAAGCPVVGVKAGGVPDLIQHGHNGYLVSTPGNTTEFVNFLTSIQQNRTLRDLLGERARQEMQQWSWQSSVDHLRRVQYPLARENFEQRWSRRLCRFVKGDKQKVA